MVKNGYKQTEIGVIPEDWEIKSFDEIAMISRGASPRPIQNPIWFDNNSSIGWVRISDVTRSGKYLFITEQRLSNLGVEKSRFVEANSLIMSICATLGRPIITLFDVCIHDGFVVFKNLTIETNYMYYYLKFIQNQWTESGQVGTQVNLNTDLINNSKIPIPPKEEQKAIAKVLSDTDELIISLEKLISKKEAIKQGTMQQLLTGKKRLSGFSGKWEEKLIKDLVNTPVTDGPHETPKFLEQGIPFLSVNNLVNNKIDLTDLRYISKDYDLICSRKCKPQKFDILLGKAASVGKVAIVKDDIDFNIWSPIALIRIREDNLPLFFYYAFQTKYILSQIELLTNSSSQGNIGMGDIEKLKFKFPFDIKEQQAIAQILSDMDNEIETLKLKLSKIKAIKDGMMEKLLMGGIRLIKRENKTNKHNKHFEDAVIIAVLSDKFATDKYPIGRKRYTKLSYLLHRKKDHSTEEYLKKAAGPYNPKTRYGGAEKIALSRNYVKESKNAQYFGFVSDKKISEAKEYFLKWFGNDVNEWLEQFRYHTNDQLELLATVDMAMQDLIKDKQEVNLENIKTIIKSNAEWKPKLEKEFFSDSKIQDAIRDVNKLFER